MFRENNSYQQNNMFSFKSLLSEKKKKKLADSQESHFFNLVFCNIKENDFSGLYSEKESRPNAPINSLVSSLILMHRKGWSYEQLFEQIDFDLKTRTALGLSDLEETPFCQATIFNFQNRVADHFVHTGENLLEKVFDNLTQEQLKTLKLKTNIQRTDSFLANSNIRSYSRLQFLVEFVIRLYHVLSDEDKVNFQDKFAPYVKQSAGQFIYRLNPSELTHKIEELAGIYHWLYSNFKDKYGDTQLFKVFERVYTEHFTIVEDKIVVKRSEELHSGILQSPDDLDATYRKKRNEHFHGQVINVTETAHPDNPLNLVLDVCVQANNVDDSVILNGRLDKMKEQAPDLDEVHSDGAFGSKENDKKMSELGITHIQTAVKGRKPSVEMIIEKSSVDKYQVSCPYQSSISQKTEKRNKACFELNICSNCPLAKSCPTIEGKQGRLYYFTEEDYLSNKRKRNILGLPLERRKIRPNVEATVKEFEGSMVNRKLKVRGFFKTTVYAYSMAVSINFGRIFRFSQENCALA